MLKNRSDNILFKFSFWEGLCWDSPLQLWTLLNLFYCFSESWEFDNGEMTTWWWRNSSWLHQLSWILSVNFFRLFFCQWYSLTQGCAWQKKKIPKKFEIFQKKADFGLSSASLTLKDQWRPSILGKAPQIWETRWCNSLEMLAVADDDIDCFLSISLQWHGFPKLRGAPQFRKTSEPLENGPLKATKSEN